MLRFLLLLLPVSACDAPPESMVSEAPLATIAVDEKAVYIDTAGTTIATRILAPEGFQRSDYEEDTFAYFLRHQPLKAHGSPVKLFNGQLKNRQSVHAAVLDVDVGNRDLQQCADAVMRLRAEYLFRERKYDRIHFNFVSGFRADYSRWRAGERIAVRGNAVSWIPSRGVTPGRAAFRKYLDMVFAYAGTASLARELRPKNVADIAVGDVFIRGGSPGHAVLVVDRVQHPESGEVRVLLAQSYMPAQDIHVLLNPLAPDGSPWFAVSDFAAAVRTPEWTFAPDELRAFPEG